MQRIALPMSCPYPTNDTHTDRQSPWWPTLAVLCLFCVLITPASAQMQRDGFTFGISTTNWTNQTTVGYVRQFSKNFAALAALDVGGGSAASQAQIAVLFELAPCCRLGFLVGPEINVYQENPTIQDKLSYLNMATAIMLWTDLNDKFSILALGEYIGTESPTPKMRLSLRLAVWLGT